MPNERNRSGEEISVGEILVRAAIVGREIRLKRKKIVKSTVFVFVIGLIIAFGSGEEYVASARLLPYRNGAGGVSSLSGLAGISGIRLPVGGEQTITAELYPEVAKSQDFRIAIAEAPLTFGTIGTKATSIEYFRNIRKPPFTEILYQMTLGLPETILAQFSTSRNAKKQSGSESKKMESLPRYDEEYLAHLEELSRRITVAADRKTSIITISAKMPDSYAAAEMVKVITDRLMERIIQYETQKGSEQYRFLLAQHERAQQRFDRAQTSLAEFIDRNRELMSAKAQIERDRLQRESSLAFETFQQFTRELETARIKMNQDTPVFTFLDKVSVPTHRQSPRRKLIVVASILFGLGAGFVQILAERIIKQAKGSTEQIVIPRAEVM
jgi:uncharacterized protein involved in exopolysaccharide biosynthesis